jgi:hypothetical protein
MALPYVPCVWHLHQLPHLAAYKHTMASNHHGNNAHLCNTQEGSLKQGSNQQTLCPKLIGLGCALGSRQQTIWHDQGLWLIDEWLVVHKHGGDHNTALQLAKRTRATPWECTGHRCKYRNRTCCRLEIHSELGYATNICCCPVYTILMNTAHVVAHRNVRTTGQCKRYDTGGSKQVPHAKWRLPACCRHPC